MDQYQGSIGGTTSALHQSTSWWRWAGHIILPLIAPTLIVWLYFTPVYVFGCVNRGLIALGVASVAFILAILTAKRAIDLKKGGDINEANWWVLTTVILLVPLALLTGPLG